jgi:SAM-dependent methyltransferase
MTTTVADYRAIYDHIIAQHPGYNDPAGSPGYRACLMEADRLRTVTGPALDVGCGVGFVVELLAGPAFGVACWGADVSRVAVDRGNQRMKGDRIRLIEGGRVPFADGHFGLVTCFDVLEHLDEADLRPLRNEMRRVLRPGGLLYCSVATRPAGSNDQFGQNLHRTVKDALWWCELMQPDEIRWRRREDDLYLFWRKPEPV